MIELLRDNPLLLLFVVAAIGYPLGRIKIAGVSLRVSAVLFAGLAIGSLDPDLKLPELVYQLGLVLFVYTVGLSSGRGFVASFRRKGLRDNLFIAGMLALTALFVAAAYSVLHWQAATAVGAYAGSLTNTPALAGALEYLKSYGLAQGLSQNALDQILAEPVVAYSITYPVGVVGMIATIVTVQRLWKIDYVAEAQRAHQAYAASSNRPLRNRTIRVTQSAATGITLPDLIRSQHWDVVFGRVRHGKTLSVANGQTKLAFGDLVTAVGCTDELNRVAAYLGEISGERLDIARDALDYRRIFVSNTKVAGHRLRDLNLPQQFGAVLTRVRRGDVEFVPHGDTVLELGDRVRALTNSKNMSAVSAFLGDSYRAVSEMDVLTFSLGIALGLLLGAIPIPLPGGVTLKLGIAGGPLVAALILGTLERTGPLVWSLPFSVNLTMRQFGLILFLAGVGTRAGYIFVTTLTQGNGLAIFGVGIVLTVATALIMLVFGYRVLKIPMGLLIGMLAGLQTQPALLGFAVEQTGDELPNVGYATVYPVAMISKIIFVQVLLVLLL